MIAGGLVRHEERAIGRQGEPFGLAVPDPLEPSNGEHLAAGRELDERARAGRE